jgi:aerobic C4-dicarboxylate transport protein
VNIATNTEPQPDVPGGAGRPASRLYLQVIVAIVLGVLLGHFFPHAGTAMKPLGDVFIALVKMLVPLVIFLTIVLGIGRMGDLRSAGRVGLKALVYFEVMTTGALIIGLVLANVLTPGAGMNIDPHTLDPSSVAAYAKSAQAQSAVTFLSNIVPETVVSAFVKGDILPVVLVAVLFGIALAHIARKSAVLVAALDQAMQVTFGVVGIVMRAAPIGAFGAIAFTVGRFGVGSVTSLGYLILSFYLAAIIFVVLAIGLVGWYCGFGTWQIVRYLREELLIVFGTSTVDSVLPQMILKLEALGCSRPVVGLVVPTGYAFNLDGACLYSGMALVFIAQATNTPLPIWQQVTIMLILMLTTKGVAGAPGGAFIAVAATIPSITSLPVAGLALLLGVDRLMSVGRAMTTLVGTAAATIAVAKWEGALDTAQMHRALTRP